MGRSAGSAALVLVGTGTPLHPAPALFEAMIEGWRRQHAARRLSSSLTADRERVVRRFQAFAGSWPWEWQPAQLDAWIAQGGWAHSTIRSYQGAVALFLSYVCDPRYEWAQACVERVGVAPIQICHEVNTAVHVCDYEGRPERRPLSRDELQALFDTADAAVDEAASSPRKGWLPAFRDATLLKVIYGWGLRRREAAMLDVSDFAPNPAAPELGRFGICHVRFAKAMRGSPPRRRAVASVMPWAVEALEQFVDEVRPHHGDVARAPALWLSERGERISPRRVDERFASWRSAAGLAPELSVHCLRHSYASHLIEDGVDPLFVQHQLGHSWASTTALYTHRGPRPLQPDAAGCPRASLWRERATMSPRALEVSYRWHLRMVMAERGMFATSDLVPLLAARGVTLSREQVYRLVAKVPERLSLTTLAALCDILECTPGDLVEPLRSPSATKTPTRSRAAPAEIRPRRARVGGQAKQ